MTLIFAESPEDNYVADLFLYNLRDFSLFDNNSSIIVHRNSDGYSIGYWTGISRINPEQTSIDLQSIKDVGFILSLNIAQRRKGHGRSLINVVEKTFRNLHCSKIRATPSGQGRLFFPKVGFNPLSDSIEYERIIETPRTFSAPYGL